MEPKDERTTMTKLKSFSKDEPITQMDPRLQKLIALKQNGIPKKATAATARDEVAVIAKVSDLKRWNELTEVRQGEILGPENPADHTVLTTGRIPINVIERVRKMPFVISLKAAQRLSRNLKFTVTETDLDKVSQTGFKGKGGKGAVVGIIDFGCAFAHKNFLRSGKTRIKKLWDQNGQKGNHPLEYGTVFTAAELNSALRKSNIYDSIGYKPGRAAHGTHVMDIAAGNGTGTGASGMAPEADIIFVELNGSDIPWSGPDTVNVSFGDSVQLLEAIKYIFDEAGDRPCVINASLGTNGGPHDGSTLVEQAIDRMLIEKKNRAMVVAAANCYADGIHAAGKIDGNGTYDLLWHVPADDGTENEMDIWYNKEAQLEVEVIAPTGESLGIVPPGQSGTVKKNGDVILFIANRLKDPNNGDNVIGIFLNDVRSGDWKVRLKNVGGGTANYHAWIERDDYGQSSFVPPHDNTFTLGSISCGKKVITVGSYDAHKSATPLSWFSSSGPTRDNREKPEISAPGHDVLAANSSTIDGVTRMSGTSMAAPAMTGALAVYLAEASARKVSLSIDDIRKSVIQSARKTQGNGQHWDRRYGHGRISAKLLLAQLPPLGSGKKKKPKKSSKPKKKAVSPKGKRLKT